MSPNDFVITAIFSASAIAAGWAYTIVVTPGGNTRAARIMFWLSATGFGSLGAVWAANQEYLTLMNYGIAGVVGAIAAMSLYWGLWQIEHFASAQERPAGQAQGVTQHNQTGPNINAPGGQVIIHPPPAPPPRQLDPDTLYQLDRTVGTVEQVSEQPASGTITFGLIRGAMNLDGERDFQYRDFVLHITRFDAEMGSRERPGGRWTERRLANVLCRIVDRRPQ
jgi:hypothetical protein